MSYTSIHGTRPTSRNTKTVTVTVPNNTDSSNSFHTDDSMKDSKDSMTNSINHMMNNSYTYNYNPKYRVTRLPNPPSSLKHGKLEFVIMDAPTDDNLRTYINELRKKRVRCVVRTCEPTYSEEPLEKAQMNVMDIQFPDGQNPTDDKIQQWLQVVRDECLHGNKSNPVAVHCVAGLGRAPVLVAIALIEISEIEPLEAVRLIRNIRRGAINQKQYQYLKSYVRRSRQNCVACTIL